jgi:hypothetical protein
MQVEQMCEFEQGAKAAVAQVTPSSFDDERVNLAISPS